MNIIGHTNHGPIIMPVTEYGVYIDGNIRNVTEFNFGIVEMAIAMGAPVGLKVEAIEYEWQAIWNDTGHEELKECADEAIEWLNDNDDDGSWSLDNSELRRDPVDQEYDIVGSYPV